ncbi:MAG: nascent polypeptide-associated complex protein [Candidatus Altiarchaeota archaeon]|nr:nascent polypeptide-associated complex protein [Candidatus Altiarchaeota archaeon]
MLPGRMNPKQMEKMMKRMGITVDEVDAQQVIIKCTDKDIIIDNPQVVKTKIQGKDSFQISGDVREESADVKLDISADDVKLVAEQAKVSEQKAKAALEKAGGDIAQAILDLKS